MVLGETAKSWSVKLLTSTVMVYGKLLFFVVEVFILTVASSASRPEVARLVMSILAIRDIRFRLSSFNDQTQLDDALADFVFGEVSIAENKFAGNGIAGVACICARQCDSAFACAAD